MDAKIPPTQSVQKGQAPKKSMMDSIKDHRTSIILVAIAVLLIGLFAGIFLVRQPQTIEDRADEVGPTCPLDAFRCSWDTEADVTYECIINEVTEGGEIEVARPAITVDPETGRAICTYTPEANKTYSCTVNAVLFEGCESTDTAQATCLASTPTPTMTPSPTLTPSPTPTPHPACYITECDPEVENVCDGLGLPNHSCTDTNPDEAVDDFRCVLNDQCVNANPESPELCWCYAATPTPSPTETPTPTPTATPTPGPSNTPNPSATVTPISSGTPTPGPSSTPNPSATTTMTPSPTDIVVVNSTSTPVPTDTLIAQGEPTSTPAPTLPVAGLPQATYLIILVGMVVVAIGLAL